MKIGNYEINISKNTKGDSVFGKDISIREMLNSIGSGQKIIDTTLVAGQADAFMRCSVLSAIITKKISAIGDARYWMQDDNGEDIEKTEEMKRVQRPNPYQSLSEFVCMVEFFSQIFGKAYITKIAPIGFENDFELFVVPNTMVLENESISRTASFAPNFDIKDYTISFNNGSTITIPAEDMFVVNDICYNPNMLGGSISRLASLRNPINTFIASYEAVNELLVNRGMLGIISLNSDNPLADAVTPQTKSDKDALEERIGKYGILRDKMKYAITMFNASFVPISSTISDLGITDIQKSCKRDIAYTYQVPGVLLDVEGSTFNNMSEAKKEFYNTAIIPETNNIMNAINKIYGFDGFGVCAFFDHVEVFQEAKRLQAQGMVSIVNAINQAISTGLMSLEDGKSNLEKYLI